MVYKNKVKPTVVERVGSESINRHQLDGSSFLKLEPFRRMDPSLLKLLRFLQFFGLLVSSDQAHKYRPDFEKLIHYTRLIITLTIAALTGEVVYDVNLRQSKLLAEQKRSTPLLTFVIVAYSWLTLIIPLICDICLLTIGPYLFRFYSRTTATVCNGMFFGSKTSVDTWFYYMILVLIALLDVSSQVVLLGVWPGSMDTYISMFIEQGDKSMTLFSQPADSANRSSAFWDKTNISLPQRMNHGATEILSGKDSEADSFMAEPKITAHLLDYILGNTHAHSDLGVSIKIICLLVQFAHTYAFLGIMILFASHYAFVINKINENLGKYEFRSLLKELIILRDSSEQISLMISVPFSLIIMLVFMRQIALNGVFIQSTMQPYENWAVSLQSFTCSVCIFMVFIYCDGLQSASKQTHRLKTEQTVINENRGGNQSIYEFLDYLDRLSKSIRITFFNIISINKSSLVGLYGHILTLTFVTS